MKGWVCAYALPLVEPPGDLPFARKGSVPPRPRRSDPAYPVTSGGNRVPPRPRRSGVPIRNGSGAGPVRENFAIAVIPGMPLAFPGPSTCRRSERNTPSSGCAPDWASSVSCPRWRQFRRGARPGGAGKARGADLAVVCCSYGTGGRRAGNADAPTGGRPAPRFAIGRGAEFRSVSGFRDGAFGGVTAIGPSNGICHVGGYARPSGVSGWLRRNRRRPGGYARTGDVTAGYGRPGGVLGGYGGTAMSSVGMAGRVGTAGPVVFWVATAGPRCPRWVWRDG
jgi:hypothetical protein